MVYLKVLNETENHNGFQYKTGLNILDKSFEETGTCVSGGLYFSDSENIHNFYSYGVWLRKVTLPKDAKEVSTFCSHRADKIILGERHSLFKKETYEEFKVEKYSDLYEKLFNIKDITEHGFKDLLEATKYLHEVLKADNNVWTLTNASRTGNLEVVRYVHEKMKAPSSLCTISEAGKYGNLEVVKYLCEIAKAPINSWAINNASINGHIIVVRYLNEVIKAPCGGSAIFYARKHGHLSVVKYLQETVNYNEQDYKNHIKRFNAVEYFRKETKIKNYQRHTRMTGYLNKYPVNMIRHTITRFINRVINLKK